MIDETTAPVGDLALFDLARVVVEPSYDRRAPR
jgi:hypothetical protein